MIGGYAMIDCTGLDLTKGSTEQTIPGIYQQTKAAMDYGKAMFAHNCVWGDKGLVTPINVFCIDFGDYIIATSSTLQIHITKADVITIVNMVA